MGYRATLTIELLSKVRAVVFNSFKTMSMGTRRSTVVLT